MNHTTNPNRANQVTAAYDAIVAFQRKANLSSLRLAQIRLSLAEHLADTLLAAPALPSAVVSADRATLLRAADFFRGLHATGTTITAREAEAELRRMAADAEPGPGRVAAEQPTETQDSLPAWLYQRFMPDGVGWENLDADDRSYWEHHARAVRRAVARGGFKADAERPAVAEQPDTQTREA